MNLFLSAAFTLLIVLATVFETPAPAELDALGPKSTFKATSAHDLNRRQDALQPSHIGFGSPTATAPDSVRAGAVYITLLPDSISGERVAAYSANKLPLMSWLKGRSFFWRTTNEDMGLYGFDLRAELESGENAPYRLDIVVW